MLYTALIQKIDISDSRAVVRYVECLYIYILQFSTYACKVRTKWRIRKRLRCVIGAIIRRSQFACTPRKRKSLIVEQLFYVQIFCIHCSGFELCVREKKERKKMMMMMKKNQRRKRRQINGTLGIYFTLEYLRVFIYRSFTSLCCGYLGTAPIPYVQNIIFEPAQFLLEK